MPITLKPRRYTSCIPPTPCTDEMRQRIDKIAESRQVSLAEVMRVALDRLLAELEQDTQKEDGPFPEKV